MTACIRCGQCCHLKIKQEENKYVFMKCKHLVRLNSGKTICRIYNNRLGVDLGFEHNCILRENDRYDYPGCPYNTNKPVINIKTGEIQWKKKDMGIPNPQKKGTK